MMRLSELQYTYQDTLKECISGITGNNRLKQKMVDNKDALEQSEVQYVQAANSGALHGIFPIDTSENIDPNVIANLTKSELKNIYETYFRSEEKPGREIYDHILNSANEKCPYCGGIGTPRNLDHFLPVAHFPQFSVVPRNLVPACRDCNMDGEADGYATRPEDQIIHPYLDNERYFSDQWIFATYQVGNDGQPGVIDYLANPPANWPDVDRLRAKSHFRDFGLSRRYSIRAAQLIGTTLSQIREMRLNGVNEHGIAHMLLTPGVNSAPFINHWQRGMYQALIVALPQVV